LTRRSYLRSLKLISAFALSLLLLAAPSAAQKTADDCSWKYEGSSRAEVKNRLPPVRGYRVHNRGRHITVKQWYDLVCGFASRVPDKREISEDEAIPGLETVRVTLKGYLLAAKFERGEDHDIHAEIGGTADWEGPHVVVELPPMPEHCLIRKKLWDLVREDRRRQGNTRETSEWNFVDPPQVLVTGYVFLDSHHLKRDMPPDEICRDSGGRGSRESGESQVQGLWELHPVIGFDRIAQPKIGRAHV
jgi:hypothetical protein